ncbi:efflux RND transporter periplasmic adaptor subunit [Cocleimonas sp. KMM 6892]|uniref:efflux RND transporter periplasmic adaptor subunit n=1 Tax=unclassified Cocleimonas TaxID=2639732 RepID=UPI002DBA0E9C|nr:MULTISPECIES: efflux RND transporter periplasmic adaptor subunit [unclassified Cocleimonas]MEB8431753.1 efflux RND transporter periplasmic adaptor subunit [Cocleimonas sp. KMM 6892]MEC4715161.1 efflux RND transporter periplasmic adaptor subunit [Cocleimonas sp. KMM 6895]MEC4744025.1 efflux RND transporter periplasmic adaptor subunit [Cocleimonas sp. KMM 6896]
MRVSYIVIPLLIGAGFYGWYWKQTHPDIIPVSVIAVEKGNVEATVANTRAGTIKACRRAKLSPSTGGQISELPYAEGDFVKKDTMLLKIWSLDLQAEVEHIKKNIIASEDTAEATCLQANMAQRTADRELRLLRSRSISQEEYDLKYTEYLVNKASCKAAKANIDSVKASLLVAQEQLKRTVLYAPFDGVIAKINGELNEYVTPSPIGIQTPPVIDLIEPGCFLVSVPVDEVDAPKIKIGMPARITLDAWRGQIFKANVSRIGSYVTDTEKQARTVEIELSFQDKTQLDDLLVGYSADADIILQTNKNVLRIPSETLVDDSHVLLFNPESKLLEKITVKKGLSNWSFTEIREGLKTGDQLVTSVGTTGVKEGVLVKVVNEKSEKNSNKTDNKND